MLGTQVMNYSDKQISDTIKKLQPPQTEEAILDAVLGPQYANITDKSVRSAIRTSTGFLRRSWLLRYPAVATILIVPTVKACFPTTDKQPPSWCITAGNPFATTSDQASRSLREVQAMYRELLKP
jgi:hypothetical protein